jgi:outer membrane protein assembly factor BamB
MRLTEKLVAASLLVLMAGCSSWNPFAKKDPKTEPAKLVELKSSMAVREAWKYSIGKSGVYAFTPALSGSSLYVVNADGALARLDAATGREAWRIKAGTDITSSPGTDGNVVAVGGAKGVILAFDANGKELWKAQASSEVLTAPVVGEGVVVVRSVDNRILGFDAKTGERKWVVQRTTPALTLRNAPGMVLGGTNVYVAQPGGKLVALTAATGVVRWETVVSEPRGATELERVSDIAGTPVVFEGEVCTVTYQGKAGCFDAATGVPRWTKPVSSDVGVAVDQRFVFTADDQGTVLAFAREGGQGAWKNEALARRRLSTPASYGRSVAIGDYQGYIHFLSREDGALIGRVSTDGSPIVSVPVVAGSNLIFQTQSGTVTALAVE